MLRSRAALATGLLVVLAAFAYGVEVPASTTVAGEEVDCGPAISASWLVAGTPDPTDAADRRTATACAPAVQRARAGVLSTMAAGALLALLGWTALREPLSGERPRRRGPQPRPPRAPRRAPGGRTATG